MVVLGSYFARPRSCSAGSSTATGYQFAGPQLSQPPSVFLPLFSLSVVVRLQFPCSSSNKMCSHVGSSILRFVILDCTRGTIAYSVNDDVILTPRGRLMAAMLRYMIFFRYLRVCMNIASGVGVLHHQLGASARPLWLLEHSKESHNEIAPEPQRAPVARMW